VDGALGGESLLELVALLAVENVEGDDALADLVVRLGEHLAHLAAVLVHHGHRELPTGQQRRAHAIADHDGLLPARCDSFLLVTRTDFRLHAELEDDVRVTRAIQVLGLESSRRMQLD
jgi:hypothetical protein